MADFSTLSLKIILLITPGMISVILSNYLIERRNPLSNFMFIVNSMLFGLFSYLILQLICLLPFIHKDLDTFYKINDSSNIPWIEILWASFFSLLIGLIYSLVYNNKWIYHLINRFKKIKISNKYGDESAFSYFLNNTKEEWVTLTDLSHSLTYIGKVVVFKDSYTYKEIILKEVDVYSSEEKNHLNTLDIIFLSYSNDMLNNIIIQKI